MCIDGMHVIERDGNSYVRSISAPSTQIFCNYQQVRGYIGKGLILLRLEIKHQVKVCAGRKGIDVEIEDT